jgi:hypothetical protein
MTAEEGKRAALLAEYAEVNSIGQKERGFFVFIDAIAEGRDSKALAKALTGTERRLESLQADVESLRASRERVFKVPQSSGSKNGY